MTREEHYVRLFCTPPRWELIRNRIEYANTMGDHAAANAEFESCIAAGDHRRRTSWTELVEQHNIWCQNAHKKASILRRRRPWNGKVKTQHLPPRLRQTPFFPKNFEMERRIKRVSTADVDEHDFVAGEVWRDSREPLDIGDRSDNEQKPHLRNCPCWLACTVCGEREVSKMFDTPVALFVFNRPEVTQRTFEAVARAKPKRLALVADGPRHRADETLCELTRKIVADVHWDCEVSTLFSDRNLGCRENVARGLSWVFSQYDRAIILEDDCVPAADFFQFCDQLLARYADDERVTMIGGSAPADGVSSPFSYLFSRYTLIWGWATWRRAWSGYDVDMNAWPEDRDGGLLERWLEDADERLHWRRRFDKTHAGHTTWDHQWTLHCWRRAGLTALPTTNLVTNIGFGSDATHTTSLSAAARLSVPSGSIDFPLRHPFEVTRDAALDKRIYREILNS